jgi:hypothetical protein
MGGAVDEISGGIKRGDKNILHAYKRQKDARRFSLYTIRATLWN